MNPVRAHGRWFFVVQSVITALLLLFILLFIKKWDGVTQFLVLLAFIGFDCVMLWLLIDATVVLFYLKKIEPVKGPQRFGKLFFQDGVTWKYLKSLAEEIEPVIQQITQRAQPFPELRDEIKEVLRTEGAQRALALVERYELEAISRAEEVKEQALRTARRIREADELVPKGVDLGIPENEIRELVGRDINRARSDIAQKEREKELFARADRYCCVAQVQKWVRYGRLDEANAVLIRAQSVIERAIAFDTEEDCEMKMKVKLVIAQDNLSFAETMMTEVETTREREKLRKRFETRIDALPPHQQITPRALLKQLDREMHQTRSFRKVLHELEQALVC